MNFITLHLYEHNNALGDNDLNLNADTIVAIYSDGNFTSVETTGNFGYRVNESPKEIVNMIENLKNRKRISGIQNL